MATEQAVHLLLDYVATYPADGIVYRSSNMILCAHADAGFLNETNSRNGAGAHIFLLENNPFPRFNWAILSIAQIVKFVMASAAKSELAALFDMARKMIPNRQILIAMGWPEPKAPIQTGYQQNDCAPLGQYDGYALLVASMPHISKPVLILPGMLAPKTGLTTTPNITQTPTMKPTDPLMQASGNQLAPKPTAILA